MSESITVSSEQIAGLAERLNQLEETFPAEERAILLAVFALASEAIARRAEEKSDEVSGFRQSAAVTGLALNVAGDLPRLGQAFDNSFTPGRAGSVAAESHYVLQDVLVSS